MSFQKSPELRRLRYDAMKVSTALLSYLRSSVDSSMCAGRLVQPSCINRLGILRSHLRSLPQRRLRSAPADDPSFISLVDNPPQLVRHRRKHGAGIIVLGVLGFPPLGIRYDTDKV